MTDENGLKVAHQIIGELILITSALDRQLNDIVIEVMQLEKTPFLSPVIASLDCARKVEILKAASRKINTGKFSKELMKHAKNVEQVNANRNIAAHSVLVMNQGNAELVPVSAAKIFKSLDLDKKTLQTHQMSEFEQAIEKAYNTIGSGDNLIKNFGRAKATHKALRQSKKNENFQIK